MDDNLLGTYLDEIGRGELLTTVEEAALSARIQQGDAKAVNRLVEANLRFVVKVASQYRSRGLAFDDLISEGNIGLMKAAAKFDARRGTRFVNFAVVYVRQQIERAIAEQTTIYKVPRDAAASTAARQNSRALSVDAPLGHRTNMSLLSLLVNPHSPLADERVYSEAVEQAIEQSMMVLNERERQIVSRFFGLDGEHETMAEIAEDMGLRRERVRQIRNKAIRRLKKTYRRIRE